MKPHPESTHTHRRIDAVGVAVLLAMTLLAVMLGFKPLVEQRLDRAEQKQQLAAERERVQTLTAATSRMRTQQLRVERAIDESELRLQPVRQLNRRVAALAELAGECELDLDVIQPGAPRSGRRYETVPIHLAGRADYAQCVRFLHEMASAFRDVALTAVELQARPNAAGDRLADFRFTLTWHAAPAMTASADDASESE